MVRDNRNLSGGGKLLGHYFIIKEEIFEIEANVLFGKKGCVWLSY